MHAKHYEELIELLVSDILANHRTALRALQDLLGGNSEVDIDSVVLAVTFAASGIEEWQKDSRELAAANDLWRLAGVLACEAIHLRRKLGVTPLVKDAVVHWMRTNDPLFFLED